METAALAYKQNKSISPIFHRLAARGDLQEGSTLRVQELVSLLQSPEVEAYLFAQLDPVIPSLKRWCSLNGTDPAFVTAFLPLYISKLKLLEILKFKASLSPRVSAPEKIAAFLPLYTDADETAEKIVAALYFGFRENTYKNVHGSSLYVPLLDPTTSFFLASRGKSRKPDTLLKPLPPQIFCLEVNPQSKALSGIHPCSAKLLHLGAGNIFTPAFMKDLEKRIPRAKVALDTAFLDASFGNKALYQEFFSTLREPIKEKIETE